MTRRRLLQAGLSLPALLRGSRTPGYNVLFIAVDDLKPVTRCYGNSLAATPNIDRLASEGLMFTRAYCQQAVCSPSRTSLLTGRRPDTTRVYDLQTHFRTNLPDVVTLPQHFRNHGYETSGFSKIYHGGLDDIHSWSIPSWLPGPGLAWNTPENARRAERAHATLERRGMRAEPTPPRSEEDRARRGPSWESRDVADNELPDGKTADAVASALRALKDKPFFLAAGFLKPHLPFTAPKRYFDLYRNAEFHMPPNPLPPEGAPAMALHQSGELRSYLDIPPEGPIPDGKGLELIRAYHAAMSYTDAQVGRLLNTLDELDLRRKTVVILWGDHGWHLGDHGLWNKHTNFEQATRAPLIVSVPGQKTAGRSTASLTEFVDIYPSLAEICGLPSPQGVEGLSFAPLLRDPGRRIKRVAFSQYPRGGAMGYSVRNERYRYTEWVVRGEGVRGIELYDYETDPLERRSIAAKWEMVTVIREARTQLEKQFRYQSRR